MFAEIEINETAEDKKAGRTHIKMSALTIHQRGQWNRRGITWLRENVEKNLESIIGAPFVVCFIDNNKTIPSGHGTLSYDEDGNCEFLDSNTVGSIQKAWIENVEIDGVNSEKLVCSGYIYKQRYPKFVKWLKEEIKKGTHIKGSVEANGKGDSKQIVYEDGSNGKDENGEWITGRVPVIFDFTGVAILLPDVVTEADSGSEVIELNMLDETQSTDKTSDDINENKKEETTMPEGANDKTIVELNEKIVSQVEELNELKNKLSATEAELSSCKEELQTAKDKEVELNELLVEANKNLEAQKAQVAELNTEIEPLRQMKADADKAKAQSEVNEYFETIKKENGFSEAELNSLQTDYVDKCDLDGLKAKETELCVAKFKAMKTAEQASTELNSTEESNNDSLFFSTKVETVETNDVDDGSDLFK